jgi:flagellar hook assembly protein FlgD
VASGAGVGPTVTWAWDSTGLEPGRYTWTMDAGPNVLAAHGVVGGPSLPPPAALVQNLAVTPAVISPNGDGYADGGTISYTLGARALVTATIEDANGATVETLFSGQRQSARAIAFGWSPGEIPDGHYTLVLTAQTEDGRSETHTVPFTIDRTLSAVTAMPATLAPGGLLTAGFALAGDAQQVTVTILGPDGSTVATLFRGALGAGAYSYAWNGLLGDGTMAPVGHYQVLVSVDDTLGTVTQTAGFDIAAPP